MQTTPRIDADVGGDGEEWSWLDALATARPGGRYAVRRLLFSLVRERCHRYGVHEGDELTCIENRGSHSRLVLRRSDGRRVEMEREYAWFVEVRALPPERSA